MHALVYRAWQRRIKGRDWYDFEWYVRHRVPLDFCHLSERIREFNGSEFSKEEFMQQLKASEHRFAKRTILHRKTATFGTQNAPF